MLGPLISWRDSAAAALFGAALLEVVNILVNSGHQSATRLVTSAAVGAIVGWMYDLAREMMVLLRESSRQLELLSQKIAYQDAALDMLVASGRYGGVVGALLTDSIGRNFRTIAFSDENVYFRYLAQALESSERFETVHRKPISGSWLATDAIPYLTRLRTRTMAAKIRLFVIEEADVAQMEADLNDPTALGQYWDRTGHDVDTFWIPVADLLRHFPRIPIPPDCVIYDRKLLISHDADRQVISFDLVDAHVPAVALFRALRDEREIRARTVFREVPRPS